MLSEGGGRGRTEVELVINTQLVSMVLQEALRPTLFITVPLLSRQPPPTLVFHLMQE